MPILAQLLALRSSTRLMVPPPDCPARLAHLLYAGI
jgi:hypothetical protein